MQRLDAETEDFILHQGGFFDDTSRPTAVYPINTQIALRHEALGKGTGMGIGEHGDPSFTLLKGHSHAVAFAQNQMGELRTGEIAGTINTNSNASGRNTPMVMQNPIAWTEELTASVDVSGTVQRGGAGGRHDGVMDVAMQVRRLTPVECERLQGFPDGYTDINAAGGGLTPDGPRYKAMGNSMAVPVMRWLGERIEKVNRMMTP